MPERSTPARRSPLWWVAVPLCLVYAVGVLALLALRFLLPAWPPLLLFYSGVGPFLYAPLLLLLPLAIVSRARVAIAAVLAVAALFLVLYLPFFLPRFGAAPAPAGGPITAMTYNLGPTVAQPAALTAAIAGAGADIVALQEIYPAAAQAIAEALAARYPHRILPMAPGSNGLLSRYPILRSETFAPARAGRPALRATLDIDGEPVEVFVMHPQPPFVGTVGPGGRALPRPFDAHLEAQLADVAARAQAAAGPALVMGDLNMSDQSRPYVVISRSLRDAFREAGFGFGFTFPVNRTVARLALPGPLVRLDYIFHNDALYAVWAGVGCKAGSDHCYVTARFERVAPAASP